MLISVITITYNAASTLGPTMESVAAQTFDDFEHIIVDGRSTDGTVELANRLGGSRMRLLSEPDNGLYDAMNKGLDMARGEYVLFLNAGDTFHSPDTLSLYASGCRRGMDIIYGSTDIVDSERKRIGNRHLEVPDILTFSSFSKGMLVCHQSFMVRKTIAPHYDLRYRFSADYDWTVKCIAATVPGKCLNLRTVVTDYLNEGVTTRNHFASLKERFGIMSNHYGRVTALRRHLEFIPRAVGRKLKSLR